MASRQVDTVFTVARVALPAEQAGAFSAALREIWRLFVEFEQQEASYALARDRDSCSCIDINAVGAALGAMADDSKEEVFSDNKLCYGRAGIADTTVGAVGDMAAVGSAGGCVGDNHLRRAGGDGRIHARQLDRDTRTGRDQRAGRSSAASTGGR